MRLQAPNPEPRTPNPQTPNPEPQTLNPKPYNAAETQISVALSPQPAM